MTKTVEAWMDEDLNEVSEEEAVVRMVAEYDDEGDLVFEYMEVVGDGSKTKNVESDPHTLRVSTYSPPQVQGDPIFKELFLEQPLVEKTEVTVLPDGSGFFVAEVPTEEEREVEEPPEKKGEEEEAEEMEKSVVDEERELRRQYWVEKLELVRDIRKRVLGEGDERDV